MCACPASHQDILKNQYTRNTFVRYHFLLKNNFLDVLLVYEAIQDLKAIIYIHDMNPVLTQK